jgi:dipeptidyl aminopeptidase/acylaminoacyl peptidase
LTSFVLSFIMHKIQLPLASLAVLLFAGAAAAQSPRAMSPVDLIEVPRVADPQLSPDGRQVLYIVDKPDWKENRRVGHVWRINADGSAAQQLTYGVRGETNPRWSPDGRRIAFLTRRGDNEDTQLYVLENEGGEARQVMKHPAAVSNIEWAPDGNTIFFLAPDAKTQEEKERDKARDDVYAYEENYKQRHLWTVNVENGSTNRVSNGNYSILNFNLSDDGKKIAFHRSLTPLLDNSDEGEVWVMNVDGSAALQLTRNTVGENGAALSPDNSQVLFVSGASATFETYHNSNLFTVPAAGGDATPVVADLPFDVDSAAWAKDGKAIYLVASTGVESQLYQLDLATKTTKPLTNGSHSVTGWRFSPQIDKHIYQVEERTRAGEVWLLAATSKPGAAAAQVTHVYDNTAKEFALPKQERIQWKGADGVTVEGLLYYPIDHQPGRKYPLVVQTHGGPASADKFGFGSWSSYVQVLAGKGYAVLKPNYRGSTGYGNPFLRDMVGHYFNQAHLDVMAGVDHVIKMGLADPDRLAKMGWSAGGHMTNKIITFTNRFKAAASGAGAANWVSMYAQSDQRHYRTPWFGGTPWQANAPIDKYWNDSPLKYVSNVKTPTIFLVGEADPRVPPPQSVEMYQALKHNGVPTRLYMAPREPHGWGELRHQLFKINAELEWFEQYVTGRTHEWTVAPGDPPRTVTRTTTQQ